VIGACDLEGQVAAFCGRYRTTMRTGHRSTVAGRIFSIGESRVWSCRGQSLRIFRKDVSQGSTTPAFVHDSFAA